MSWTEIGRWLQTMPGLALVLIAVGLILLIFALGWLTRWAIRIVMWLKSRVVRMVRWLKSRVETAHAQWAKERRERKRSRLETQAQEAQDRLAGLETEIDDLPPLAKEASDKRAELEQEIENLTAAVKEASASEAELEQKMRLLGAQAQTAERTRDEAQKELRRARAQAQRAEQKRDKLQAKIDRLQRDSDDAEHYWQNLEKEKSALEAQARQAERKRAGLQEQIPGLTAEAQDSMNEQDRLETALSDLEVRTQELEAKRAKLDKEDSKRRTRARKAEQKRDKLQAEIDRLRFDSKEAEHRHANLNAEVSALEDQARKADKKRTELKRQIRSLRVRAQEAKGRNTELQRENSDLQAGPREGKDRAAELEREIGNLTAQAQAAEKRRDESRKELRRLRAQAQRAEQKRAKLEDRIARFQTPKQEAEHKHANLKAEVSALEDQAQKAEDRSPELEKEIRNHTAQAQEARDRRTALEQKIRRLGALARTANKTGSEARKKIRRLETRARKAEQKRAKLQEKVDRFRIESKEAEDNLAKLGAEMSALEARAQNAEHERADPARQIPNLTAEAQDLKDEQDRLETELSVLRVQALEVEAKWTKLQNKISYLEAQRQETKDKKSRLEHRKEELEAQDRKVSEREAEPKEDRERQEDAGRPKGYRYFFALLVPALWLFVPILVRSGYLRVSTRDATLLALVNALSLEFGTWFYWPLVLWFGIYVLYVLGFGVDRERAFYRQAIAPRKSVWLTFGAVVLTVSILVTGFMLFTSDQVTGLEAVAENLAGAIEETQTHAQNLRIAVYNTTICDGTVTSSRGLATYDSRAYTVSLDSNCQLIVVDCSSGRCIRLAADDLTDEMEIEFRAQLQADLLLQPRADALAEQLSQLRSRREVLSQQLEEEAKASEAPGSGERPKARVKQLKEVTAQIAELEAAIEQNLSGVQILTQSPADTLQSMLEEIESLLELVGKAETSYTKTLRSLADGIKGQIDSIAEDGRPDMDDIRSMLDEISALLAPGGEDVSTSIRRLRSFRHDWQQMIEAAGDGDAVEVEGIQPLVDPLRELIGAAGDGDAVPVERVQPLVETLRELIEAVGKDSAAAERLESFAEELRSLVEEAGDDGNVTVESLEAMTESIDEILAMGERLQDVAANLATLSVSEEDNNAILGLLQERADEIYDIAYDMQPTASVLTSDRTIPILMISTLFVVFLLLPWLLYLSFIMSKRSDAVRDRRETIRQLGLRDQFLYAPVTNLGDEQQTAAQEVSKYLLQASRALESHTLNHDAANSLVKLAKETLTGDVCQRSPMLGDIKKQLETVETLLQNSKKQKGGADSEQARAMAAALTASDSWTGDEEKVLAELLEHLSNEALEVVIEQRRFYSREYILPLIILTALTLVGWFYVFFPDALMGLADLIQSGASLQELTGALTESFTAVTMTFAGAWLYIMVQLVNRWVQDDLEPRSYLYSALRLAIALLVGWAFAAWSGKTEPSILLVLAFAVGAAPLEFVHATWRALGKAGSGLRERISGGGEFQPPDWGSKHSLTELEDVTIWDEGRLYLEGVRNVHALATADLVRVVLSTPFDAQQLIDWVDQALLCIHAKDLWWPGLTAVGIRSASDLCDSCLVDDSSLALSQRGPDPEKLKKLTRSFNAAQLMAIGAGDPRYKVFNAGASLELAAEKLGTKAGEVKELSDSLDANDEATLDNLTALRAKVSAAPQTQIETVKTACGDVHTALTAAKVTDAELLSAWEADTGTIASKLSALEAPLTKANGALKEKEGTELKLSRAKLKDDDETIKKAAQDLLKEVKLQMDGLSTAIREAKDTIQTAKESLDRKHKKGEPVLKAGSALSAVQTLERLVTSANEVAQKLDGDKEQTWDNVLRLQNRVEALQVTMGGLEHGLKDASEKLGAMQSGATYVVAEAKRDLDNVSVKDASDKLAAAKIALDGKSADKTDSLDDGRKKVVDAVTAVEALEKAIKDAANAIASASLPLRLTVDILEIMLAAIKRDPNIVYVDRFWENRMREAEHTRR